MHLEQLVYWIYLLRWNDLGYKKEDQSVSGLKLLTKLFTKIVDFTKQFSIKIMALLVGLYLVVG